MSVERALLRGRTAFRKGRARDGSMNSHGVSMVLIALACVVATGQLSGQVLSRSGSVHGTAVDSTGRLLADVQIEIEGLKRSTRTSEQGWFRIDSVEEGSHVLSAKRLGFRPIVLSLRVRANDTTYAQLVLKSAEQTLAPVTVRATPSSAAPSTGFDERLNNAQGAYFTAADIARLNPSRVSQLLRRVPTLRVAPNGEIFSGRGKTSLLSKACANGLPIYVDNVLLGGGSADDPSTLSDGFFGKGSPQNPTARAAIDLLNPTTIAGIEVYSGPATVPPNIAGANSSCGAILIWTKQK